jgi:predicted hydrocarbon binding protein
MDSESRLKCHSLLEKTEYYDDEGEWRIAGSDYIIIGGAAIRAWAKVTEQVLGEGAQAIMFLAGKRSGEQFSRALLGEGIRKEGLQYALETFLTNCGWGKVWVHVDFQKIDATVRIRNCFTARQTTVEKPVCHFINGFICGVFTLIFESEEIDCSEKECTAKGDKFCEFRVLAPLKNGR